MIKNWRLLHLKGNSHRRRKALRVFRRAYLADTHEIKKISTGRFELIERV